MDKKILCVFLFLVTFQQCLLAQDYRPLLEKGSEWYSFFQAEFGIVIDQKIQTIKDTVIENNLYYKVDITTCDLRECFNEDIVDGGFHTSYLREDVTKKKIYQRYIFYDTIDYLLYDFSLMPGDTFNNGFYQMVLDSITDYADSNLDCFGFDDEIKIDTPKVFYFTEVGGLPRLIYSIIWIEGIGSLAGLLENTSRWGGGGIGFGAQSLLCHKNGQGTNLFRYTYCDFYDNPCQLTSTKNTENQFTFHVFPNPTQDQITVELPDGRQNFSIRVYDLQGRAVVVSEESVIEVSHLPKGVYVVAVFEEGRWLGSEKVVKE